MRTTKVLSGVFSALLLAGCATDKGPLEYVEGTDLLSRSSGDCIEFEGFAAGDIITEAYTSGGEGPITVSAINPDFPGANAAMIFDSSAPTGGDDDLGTPNSAFGGPGIGVGGGPGTYQNDIALGNLLIVTEDFDSADPDDADLVGAGFSFDFSACGTVSISSITIVDVDGESDDSKVLLYDASMTLIASYDLPETGDNGVAIVGISSPAGVSMMSVVLNGSGAIDNICFDKDTTTATGCTRTIGYWKNHLDEIGPLLPVSLGDAAGSSALTVDTEEIAEDVLKQKTYGKPSNGVTKLYAQLLAAKLNILSGADDADISTVIADADAWLADNDYTAWSGLDSSTKSLILSWKDSLDDYNNGVIGPGHCDD